MKNETILFLGIFYFYKLKKKVLTNFYFVLGFFDFYFVLFFDFYFVLFSFLILLFFKSILITKLPLHKLGENCREWRDVVVPYS
jgi:hypothetical protein